MKSTGMTRQASAVSATAMLHVTVRAGLFFDGTGNNRVNSQIGADCQAMMEINNGQHICECAGRHSDPGSSYSNDLSNIARLVGLYRHQYVARNDGEGLKVYWPLYISGAGTTSGAGDSLWPGQSFGRGTTGVVAKVEQAIKKLGSRLRAFALDNPGCVIETLELDVFGFSRGAASARHFINEVLKRDQGALEPALASRKVPLGPDFDWSSVHIKVVGLFDTVAAIGSLKDLCNGRDSTSKRVNLYLPPGCAQQVLHLVAGDESRRNFALNSIAPEWGREIVLPGAHADIGGGYHPQMNEKLLLTRPRMSIVYRDTPCESSSAWLQAQADLQSLDAGQWIDPEDRQASLRVECCESYSHARSSAFGVKSVMASVCLRRQVFGHLSRVHLRIMHALACDEGVPFEPIPDTADLRLVPELEGIACKLIGYARGGEYTLDAHEERLLRWRYIHRSAHWNAVIGRVGSISDAVFVHAPEPGGRVRYPNVGQPGYRH
ncbi:T6SS phospholipase effector Tle1-like catalytic domain-containing protein [Pseudomonas sp. NPDC089734]|uniref:T6SS phospholipase effector Tle1-like catalytic domain-containing protein n=1 Tax=Pseudomonas sp. NPDC089734 TaxID=3364469 RepID=UPI003800CEC8